MPEPTLDELLRLHAETQRRREAQDREREWRNLRETARRTAAGELVARDEDGRLPSYLRDPEAVGPLTVGQLRSSPKSGRILQAGIDTWSPAWYAAPASALERAMAALAPGSGRKAQLLPDRIMGHRVGWFPEHGLVFAEGHPGGEMLGCPDELPSVLNDLEQKLCDIGVRVGPASRAGVRRLDATVDLHTDSAAEGLAILAGVAALSVPGGKLVAYRAGRAVETVLMKSGSGKTVARVYDKGVESGRAPRGRLIRPEDQRRYVKAERRDASELTSGYVREQFRRRFVSLYRSAKGVKVAGPLVLTERLREAIEAGMIEPSRARSLVGYLVLDAANVPQGSRSTRYALEKECRELGLVVGDGALQEVEVDLGAVLEECLEAEAWERRC